MSSEDPMKRVVILQAEYGELLLSEQKNTADPGNFGEETGPAEDASETEIPEGLRWGMTAEVVIPQE